MASIESMEPRTHLSVAASPPADEGDWTGGHVGRITVSTGGATGRPADQYTFTTSAAERLAISLKPTGGGTGSVVLGDAASDAAYTAHPRTVAGVVPVGAYTGVVSDEG